MIKFTAILKDSGHPIKIDSDGQAEIVFSVPASDLAGCLPLAAMGKKALVVGVKEVKEPEGGEDEGFEAWLTKE